MADGDINQRIAFKAVIVNDKNEVLVLREANTYEEGTQIGRYGLPGGRLQPGEAWKDGLSREVHEETGLEVEIVRPLCVGEWRPTIKGVPHQIVALFMVCKPKDMNIRLSEEHDHYEWVSGETWQQFDVMSPENNVFETYFAENN